MAVVTLLSDFGHDDPYVGVMKGVMCRVTTELQLVDLTHEIPPQDVAAGAFWLRESVPWFPAGTVHLAVVDPGVGGKRRGLIVTAGDQVLVGPDNGLLTPAAKRLGNPIFYEIDVFHLGLDVRSNTFHGRDVFAPVAARLAAHQLDAHRAGPRVDAVVEPPNVEATQTNEGWQGVVVMVDRFGNALTSIPGEVARALGRSARVLFNEHEVPVVATYSDVAPGEPLALVSSLDTVELAVRDGSAALTLGATRGQPVVLVGEGV